VQLVRDEPLNLCVDEDLYLTDEELEAVRAQFAEEDDSDSSN